MGRPGKVATVKTFFLALVTLTSLTAAAGDKSFRPGWARYPTPESLLNRWTRIFPLAIKEDLPRDCRLLTNENQGFLGLASPLTGEAAQSQPGVAFASWSYRCLRSASTSEAQGLSTGRGDDVTRAWSNGFAGRAVWRDLTLAEKEVMLTALFEARFGPFEVFEEVSPGFDRQRLLAKTVDQLDRVGREVLPVQRLIQLPPPIAANASNTYLIATALFSLEDLMMY